MVAKTVKNVGGRPRLYDWRRLLAQSLLRRGQDYLCSDASMAQMARTAAAARGVRVTVRYGEGTVSIVHGKRRCPD